MDGQKLPDLLVRGKTEKTFRGSGLEYIVRIEAPSVRKVSQVQVHSDRKNTVHHFQIEPYQGHF